jgi:hypothetical protein
MDRRNERGGRNHRPGCLCSFWIWMSPAEAVGADLTLPPPQSTGPTRYLELDFATVRVLLGELDARLRDRVAASVYLVGGSALARL